MHGSQKQDPRVEKSLRLLAFTHICLPSVPVSVNSQFVWLLESGCPINLMRSEADINKDFQDAFEMQLELETSVAWVWLPTF